MAAQAGLGMLRCSEVNHAYERVSSAGNQGKVVIDIA